MSWKVITKKSILKSAKSMPMHEQKYFAMLLQDLANKGPVLENWNNYGILAGTQTHHCHLSFRWVACWIETQAGIEVEVTYVGSRGSAPYAKH